MNRKISYKFEFLLPSNYSIPKKEILLDYLNYEKVTKCGSLLSLTSSKRIWEAHEEEMLSISKTFPDVLFYLYCRYDYMNVDLKYFKDGKMQISKGIIHFDKCKL